MKTMEKQIKHHYKLLQHEGYWTRLGALDLTTKVFKEKMVKGIDSVIDFAMRWHGTRNVFIARNPRKTEANDVAFYSAINVDIDPIRPVGEAIDTSAYSKVLAVADAIATAYKAPYSILASGNGAHLVWSIPSFLPQDEALFQKQLMMFEDELRSKLPSDMRLDTASDSQRFMKLAGSLSVKGQPELWRYAKFIKLNFQRSDLLIQYIQSLKPSSQSSTTTLVREFDLPTKELLNTAVTTGGRHQATIRLASYLHLKKIPYDVALSIIQTWNKEKCSPPQEESKVERDVDDIYKRFELGKYKHFESESSPTVTTPEDSQIEIIEPHTHYGKFEKFLYQTQDKQYVELPTGFGWLDVLTNGFKRGHVFTVGARPSVGKSSFMSLVAYKLASKGKKILFLPTEDDWQSVWCRIFAIATEIPFTKIFEHRCSQDELAQISAFGEVFKKLPLFIEGHIEPHLELVESACAKYNPDVVIFDHIQQAGSSEDKAYGQIKRFLRGLKRMARERNLSVLLASQLHRMADVEKPSIRHLKESSVIEEISQAILLLSPISSGDPEAPITQVLFDLAKNKFGPGRREKKMMFESKIMKFIEKGDTLNERQPSSPTFTASSAASTRSRVSKEVPSEDEGWVESRL